MNPMDDILRYRAAISQNRETFLLNYKTEFATFDQFDKIYPHFAPVSVPARRRIRKATAS